MSGAGRGEGLLAPVPVAAILVLLVNDHWAKAAFPGVITGKVSDVAGLAFFPLLLQGLAELAGAPVSRRVLAAACAATAVAFVAVKTWAPATEAAEWAFGCAQWPARAVWAWVAGFPVPAVAAARIVPDPTDLVAVPAVLVAAVSGARRGATGARLPARPSPR
jgi:hypothetical protein